MENLTITIEPDNTFAYGVTVRSDKQEYTIVANSLQDAFNTIETASFANFVKVFFE